MNESKYGLIQHVLRLAEITYPKQTKVCDLSKAAYRRLKITIDCILYDIKLIFLDLILDDLSNNECQEMMEMIYAFSRRLEITFVISAQRPRYALFQAFFDQVMVIGTPVSVGAAKAKRESSVIAAGDTVEWHISSAPRSPIKSNSFTATATSVQTKLKKKRLSWKEKKVSHKKLHMVPIRGDHDGGHRHERIYDPARYGSFQRSWTDGLWFHQFARNKAKQLNDNYHSSMRF
ncbi:hypothetical protein RFI_20866, partial [Reticulomyxa filosa]